MLELLNIKKDYVLKDQEPVHALKGISLKFRKNEFVAILGPSGCGKTTLLNITGGLDHYDDGDLVIKGVSTKDFKDADWDTYRNHSIGFVFQSYNLIPHQTILKNVELALTIAGLSKEERTRRAKEALDKVGLKGLYRKKPNQMSGGQMQRVAIARALVNNPEIVLADEPTGALDSETSVQIMDLLKEVAKSHLIIMVTHNPDLAEQYATRIVNMKDGEITGDSNPYDGVEIENKEEEVAELQVNKGKKKHSSMSFFTAFGLSLSNLISKLRRTILVSLAGSIGIIGVSTILGVSCGVNNYIDNMQDDMLSSYPITVAEESVDLTSLITGLTTQEKKNIAKFDTKTRIGMDSMISYLLTKYTDLTNVKTNDLTETFVKYLNQMPKSYYSAMKFNYGIDPTNNIYTDFTAEKGGISEKISVNGLTQRYIKTLMTVKGFSDYAQFVDLFAGFMNELPKEKNYIMSQYDLIAGDHYAEADNEMMLVVDDKTTLTDLIYAQMGYYPQDEFLNIAKKAIESNKLQKQYLAGEITKEDYEAGLKALDEKYRYDTSFTYEDVLNHEFIYLPHNLMYDDKPDFVSHKEIEGSMSGNFTASGDIPLMTGGTYHLDLDYTVVLGGLKYDPNNDAISATLIALDNNNSMQLAMNQALTFKRDNTDPITNKKKSVVDGKWTFSYGNYNFELNITTDMNPQPEGGNPVSYNIESASLTTNVIELLVLSNIIQEAHVMPIMPLPQAIREQLQTINFTNGKVSETTPITPDYYYEAYLNKNEIIKDYTWEELEALGARKMKIAGVLRAKSKTQFGTLSRGVYYSHAFAEKYLEDASTSQILGDYKTHISSKRFQLSTFNAYTRFMYDDYSDAPEEDDPSWHPTPTPGFANALNGGFNSALSSLFLSFMGGSDNLDIEKEHIRAVGGLKIIEIPDPSDPHDSSKFRYDTDLLPKEVAIYPKSFELKDKVTNYLKEWNKDKTLIIDGQEVPKSDREDITYTDTIGLIITVISTMVTTVSIALIAFTSLSLVVSCFMIAVITYISVMERVKEIGVIRSLGGRKRDVSTLFISENLITGLASGVIGIIFTYILQLIINAIVAPFGVSNICALPFYYALMMIGISVLLSVISGLIPSLSASKQDPVVALRTE